MMSTSIQDNKRWINIPGILTKIIKLTSVHPQAVKRYVIALDLERRDYSPISERTIFLNFVTFFDPY